MDGRLGRLVRIALEEDVGSGDVTTAACVPAGTVGEAVLSVQAEGVLSGLAVLDVAVSQACVCWGETCTSRVEASVTDGTRVAAGQAVARLTGSLRVALSAERTILNFLQHLSGVATETSRYASAIEGTGARIVDTRKTTPCLRHLVKAAVRHGGGVNHRFGLYDGVLIKDNHIAASGGVAAAVEAAKRSVHHLLRIQVECETPVQADEAVAAGADALLLDNMHLDVLRSVVQRLKGQVLLEASGGITLANVRAVAETGVDLISVGAITHSAPVLPMHMEIAR